MKKAAEKIIMLEEYTGEYAVGTRKRINTWMDNLRKEFDDINLEFRELKEVEVNVIAND